MTRTEAISQLADIIAAIRLEHPVRVGIDGVDCAGKTMLADELVEPLRSRGRSVIRSSIDGFHNPREIRHRQGRGSPRGYFQDSFNIDAVLSCVLLPLGPGGDLRYQTAQFDFRTDSEVSSPVQTADPSAILVFEGIFLHRPELLPHWDFTVFVDTGFDVTIRRAFVRDLYLFETEEKTRSIYEQRYIPGQKFYLSEQRPIDKANVVFVNDDIKSPELTIRRTTNKRPEHIVAERAESSASTLGMRR
jgi:uridine kinase